MMKLKRMIPLLLLAIFIAGCDKENLPATGSFGFVNPDLDHGISLQLTYPDGNTKTIRGDRVFGWGHGQLLNGDYYRHIRGGGNGTSFDFRFSFPKTVQADDVIPGIHNLRATKLRLEQTGNLGAMQTEFWLGSTAEDGEFDPFNNLSGTLNFKQDVNSTNNTYSVVAEIEGEVLTKKGGRAKVSGGFWSKKLTVRN